MAFLVEPILQIGAQGEKVRRLQLLLNARVGTRRQIAVDGKFGATTEKAVKVVQFQFLLEPDGVVGVQTWQVLQTGDLLEKPVLGLGSSGKRVVKVQQLLRQGKFYSGFIDGYFGLDTEAAVLKLQKICQLPIDGIIDEATWQAVMELAYVLGVIGTGGISTARSTGW